MRAVERTRATARALTTGGNPPPSGRSLGRANLLRFPADTRELAEQVRSRGMARLAAASTARSKRRKSSERRWRPEEPDLVAKDGVLELKGPDRGAAAEHAQRSTHEKIEEQQHPRILEDAAQGANLGYSCPTAISSKHSVESGASSSWRFQAAAQLGIVGAETPRGGTEDQGVLASPALQCSHSGQSHVVRYCQPIPHPPAPHRQ